MISLSGLPTVLLCSILLEYCGDAKSICCLEKTAACSDSKLLVIKAIQSAGECFSLHTCGTYKNAPFMKWISQRRINLRQLCVDIPSLISRNESLEIDFPVRCLTSVEFSQTGACEYYLKGGKLILEMINAFTKLKHLKMVNGFCFPHVVQDNPILPSIMTQLETLNIQQVPEQFVIPFLKQLSDESAMLTEFRLDVSFTARYNPMTYLYECALDSNILVKIIARNPLLKCIEILNISSSASDMIILQSAANHCPHLLSFIFSRIHGYGCEGGMLSAITALHTKCRELERLDVFTQCIQYEYTKTECGVKSLNIAQVDYAEDEEWENFMSVVVIGFQNLIILTMKLESIFHLLVDNNADSLLSLSVSVPLDFDYVDLFCNILKRCTKLSFLRLFDGFGMTTAEFMTIFSTPTAIKTLVIANSDSLTTETLVDVILTVKSLANVGILSCGWDTAVTATSVLKLLNKRKTSKKCRRVVKVVDTSAAVHALAEW